MLWMGVCDAKIRPFPNVTELACERDAGHGDYHRGTLRDYAYRGSETVVEWAEDDHRTFRGEWRPCSQAGCVLPQDHRGRHTS